MYLRNFISMNDVSEVGLRELLRLSKELKDKLKNHESHRRLEGKTLAMIFEKPSTRTRVSFETGMYQLGGHALYLSASDLQLGRGETIEDTARVLSGYVDCIMARTFKHETVVKLAESASVPVINGLSDLEHPCQILADLLTIQEEKGDFKGLKIAYIGDGNNVAHSLMLGCAKLGMSVSVAAPKGYAPDSEIAKLSHKEAERHGAFVEITTDPGKAASQADVLYTDVWVSMGQDKEKAKRLKVFKPFQINEKLFKKAKPDCIVLHCLPAHRGLEITGEVMDGMRSRIFQQAENRLHSQKALLVTLVMPVKRESLENQGGKVALMFHGQTD
jgi:ornithine carbamoyltransferase